MICETKSVRQFNDSGQSTPIVLRGLTNLATAKNLGDMPDFYQVSIWGTFVGTFGFRGTLTDGTDGTFPVGGIPAAGGTEVTQGTVPGIWTIPRPTYGFHVVTTAWTSGLANVFVVECWNSNRD